MNISFKGLPVHYEITGEGPPLILLHGFNENSSIWESIVPKLSNSNCCIQIDLPGFGSSPLPGSLNLKYMAEAVHRIIEELKLDKPVVIGHSMGGYVTLELVNQHPDLLSGAGLFHSTAIADSDERKQNRLKTLEFLEKSPVENFFKIFVDGLFAPQNLNTINKKSTEKIIYQTNRASVIGGIQAMLERQNRTDVLRNSSFPWLFVAGKYDQIIPVEHLSLQASFCNIAMFEILYNSGHIGMIEEPGKSSEIILKFAELVKINNKEISQ